VGIEPKIVDLHLNMLLTDQKVQSMNKLHSRLMNHSMVMVLTQLIWY